MLFAELVVPAEVAPRLEVALDVLGVSTLGGGAKVFADAVNNGEVVNAFEPAEAEPDEANEEEAPAPDAPEDALD